MITLETEMTLDGLTGQEVTSFMLDPRDDHYQAWWPGTHQEFHVLRPGPSGSHVGDVVLMDEYVGSRHLRMAAEVVEAVPGRRVVWQVRWWRLRLPIRISLDLRDGPSGVLLTHTLRIGWTGPGRVLDPLLRLYVSSSFARDMDQHARTEFSLLRSRLGEP